MTHLGFEPRTLPGKKPCIYYLIMSDMESSNDFISSLFCTFLFIKLVRYADSREDGRSENDVYFLLDEFANLQSNQKSLY